MATPTVRTTDFPDTAGMTHYSEHTTHVTPGFIFSNIPGSLGYHPEESLIVFLFHREDNSDTGYRYTLGPMLRADIEHLDQPHDFLGYVCGFEPHLIFAVAIGSEASASAALEFEDLCCELDLPLAAVWHVPELYSGAPYERIGGESAAELGPFTSGRNDWDRGQVAEILAAPSMEAFRRRGELPELSRAESYAFLSQPNPNTTRRERQGLSKRGRQHALALLAALEESSPEEAEYMVDSLLDDVQDVIDTIISQQLTPEEICEDMDLIEQCAVYFSHPSLRDPLLQWAVSDYAQAFYALSVAIARSTDYETKASALCCAALSASYTGQKHRVLQALQLAHEGAPKHRLTVLMVEALHCGGLEMLYQACHEGALLARKALLSS